LTGGIFTAVANALSSLLSSIGSLEVTWKVLDPEIFDAMAFTTTLYVFTSRIQKLVKEHTLVISPCCTQDHWVLLLHRITLGWHGGSYVTQLVGRLGDLGSTKTSDSYPVSSSSGRPDFPQRMEVRGRIFAATKQWF
jgi:hypothetical protein